MQTTKFLFVIGAATILAAPLQVSAAPDNEAQAKMRAALRQKMEELNAPSAPAPARAVPPPPAVAPAPAPRTTATRDEEAHAKMREALRQKMQELNPTSVIAPTAVVPAPPAPVQPPAAPTKPRVVEQRFSDLPAVDKDAQAARMREALRQKIAAEQAASAPPPVVSAPAKPAPTAPSAPVVVAPSVTKAPEPALAPAPIPASKQARLATLLQLYKADTITPQQYHTQRAKIVAEP